MKKRRQGQEEETDKDKKKNVRRGMHENFQAIEDAKVGSEGSQIISLEHTRTLIIDFTR